MIDVHVYDGESMSWTVHMFHNLNYSATWHDIDKALALQVDGVTEDTFRQKGSEWTLIKSDTNNMLKSAEFKHKITGDKSYLLIFNGK